MSQEATLAGFLNLLLLSLQIDKLHEVHISVEKLGQFIVKPSVYDCHCEGTKKER